MKKIITLVIIVILGIVAIPNLMFTVQPGERAFLVTLGEVQEVVYSDGLHFKTPLVTRVVKFDIQTQKEQTKANASSKDLQRVTCDVAINFDISEKAVISLYKQVGNVNTIKTRIIDPTIQEVMKASTARYTAEELITKRQAVSDDTIAELQDRLGKMGIEVTALNIIDFQFSEEFNLAIEAKVKAEQESLTQKNVLARKEYEAKQIIVTAQAQAEAIKIQAQAINSQGGADYVALQAVAKWNGTLPQYIMGSNTTMMMGLNNVLK